VQSPTGPDVREDRRVFTHHRSRDVTGSKIEHPVRPNHGQPAKGNSPKPTARAVTQSINTTPYDLNLNIHQPTPADDHRDQTSQREP
jgi:hypothetical protein